MSSSLLARLALAWRSIYRDDAKLSAYFDFYFVLGAIMPCMLAYLLFLLSGHERYSPRYFIFSTSALAVLLTLSIKDGVRLVDSMLASFAGFRSAHYCGHYFLPVIMLVAALVVVPTGYKAATRGKPGGDWRGIAQQMANLASSEPDKSYILYQSANRRSASPTLNYYLTRFSERLRVHDTVTPHQERKGTFPFEAETNEIAKHDYLLLVFTHHGTKNFPRALAALTKRYRLHYAALKDDRGFIVFKTR